MSKLVNPNFHFEYTFLDEILKGLEKLDSKKTSQVNDIPVKITKKGKGTAAFFIHHNLNNLLSSSTFPTTLKHANVRPVF